MNKVLLSAEISLALTVSGTVMAMGFTDMLTESMSQSFKIDNKATEPTVLDVSREFNRKYTTDLFTLIISNADKSIATGNEVEGVSFNAKTNSISGYDPKNEEGPSLTADLIRADNGRYLYMLTATMEMGGLYSDEAIFFDVNWNNGIISPLPGYQPAVYRTPFQSFGTVTEHYFADEHNSIIKGYEITDGLFLNFSSVFTWDGLKHTYRGSRINLPKQKILSGGTRPEDIAYFAFCDIDGDGNSELFLRSADHSMQTAVTIRAYEKNEQILLITDDRSEFKFHENGLSATGSCGSGCSSSHYVLVSESRSNAQLNVVTHTAPDGKSESTCSLTTSEGEKEISSDKADEFIKKLGNEKNVKLSWEPLLELSFLGSETL